MPANPAVGLATAISGPVPLGGPVALAGPIAVARQPKQSHEREIIHVVPGGLALGPVLAVAGDRAVDDPWVDRAHLLVAHAQTVEHARAEGLQHHVVVAHQAQQHLAAGSLFRSMRIERLLRFSERKSADLALSSAPS